MVSESYIFHCPIDFSELERIETKTATNNKTRESVSFPIYQCKYCKKLYTAIATHDDQAIIRLGEKVYINLRRYKDEIRYRKYVQGAPQRLVAGTECYVFLKSRRPQVCRKCGSNQLIKRGYEYLTNNARDGHISVLECAECGVKHINYHSFISCKEYLIPYNSDELPAMKDFIERETLRKLEETIAKKRKQKEKDKVAKKIDQREREEALAELKERVRIEKEKAQKEREHRLYLQRLEEWKAKVAKRREEERIKETISSKDRTEHTEEVKKIQEQEKHINVKDFVVRRTVFKCRYNNHHLQNVDAIIDVIDKKENIRSVKIPAGFCPECNTFFIMESVYQNLKMKGVLICRISNEKAYLSNNAFMNEMQLAEESILKQFGYSVSQEEGLSSITRRKILSLIIDNHILTKNEIIGYLDFFINQRKYQNRFAKAIDKWESDREFVAEYRKGDYKQYGVGGISRKY